MDERKHLTCGPSVWLMESRTAGQGLTLVHVSAQLPPFSSLKSPLQWAPVPPILGTSLPYTEHLTPLYPPILGI